jgi:hypothetical protein
MRTRIYKTEWFGFCVQGPSAIYLLETFSGTSEGARKRFLEHQSKQVGFSALKPWRGYYRRGYRVIPLTITTP